MSGAKAIAWIDLWSYVNPLDAASHYREAMELSERYAARYLTRALDVLLIAAALEMKAAAFVSFDQRQRKLAAEVGLTILPASFDSQ